MTPLTHKLQMKPGKTWLIYNPPEGYLSSLSPLPEGVICTSNPEGNFDGIQLFAKNKAELSLVTYPKGRSEKVSMLLLSMLTTR